MRDIYLVFSRTLSSLRMWLQCFISHWHYKLEHSTSLLTLVVLSTFKWSLLMSVHSYLTVTLDCMVIAFSDLGTLENGSSDHKPEAHYIYFLYEIVEGWLVGLSDFMFILRFIVGFFCLFLLQEVFISSHQSFWNWMSWFVKNFPFLLHVTTKGMAHWRFHVKLWVLFWILCAVWALSPVRCTDEATGIGGQLFNFSVETFFFIIYLFCLFLFLLVYVFII